ncbi:sulfatase [Gilvimarinus sp. SDUM040013]|uniref:Sulfatase n=1 Tax=Gilvimarinus gilvus TaxID=3058038 RepID=A0ABU4RYT5_9GAMM|nr:sulfatase [Gilvimarinus sp. SDUM040013]MDO3385616.1 sulfatase [Gilvimarinus sp. SDUM040013]MDX6849950.1 sulfatase [Gilvimarinus sp. SDUM040013]
MFIQWFQRLLPGLLLCVVSHTYAASENTPMNVIYILTDDQRYDEMGFMNKRLNTPNMDKLANEGVHFRNAFVTTALCSPSRASILTGQYMHNHGVVDNNNPAREGTVYFPSYLQKAGYETSFFGKWHMGGHGDEPQPGFDHWLSFAGQGHYYPVKRSNGEVNQFNINGTHVPQKGYITDELTDYALGWLDSRESSKPFFMYLSHKAVHADFKPAPRHKDQYADVDIEVPASQANTEENYHGKPMWVKNQRNSWHGVDFPYHSELDVQEYKRQYHRTLSAVDDSIGRILTWLEDNGMADNTVVMLMGDNGFMFGEHGLIDKRNAYEESMRVPLLAYAPGYLPKGKKVDNIVANLDIAPTVLDIAGVTTMPEQFEGASFLPLAQGKSVEDWREELVYEYYWEFNYPHTPTTFALRSDKYKLIQYHGVWDTEELYDLENDPKEMNNLIESPEHQELIAQMRHELFLGITNSNGENVIPYTEKYTPGAVYREKDRSEAADFPERWKRKEGDKVLRDFLKPKPKHLVN